MTKYKTLKSAVLGKNGGVCWVLLTIGIVLSLVGFTVMPWINIVYGGLVNHLSGVITGFFANGSRYIYSPFAISKT